MRETSTVSQELQTTRNVLHFKVFLETWDAFFLT